MEKVVIKTIDEYILGFLPEVQEILQKTRQTIRAAAPEASEKMSWGMPTFYLKGNLIHFAANKSHLGIYPGVDCLAHFEKQLVGYKTSKGAVQFPYKQDIPYALIQEMTRFNIAQNN